MRVVEGVCGQVVRRCCSGQTDWKCVWGCQEEGAVKVAIEECQKFIPEISHEGIP